MVSEAALILMVITVWFLALTQMFFETVSVPFISDWSSWGTWVKCSVTCGGGIKSRNRTCLGGRRCPGDVSLSYKGCNNNTCPRKCTLSQSGIDHYDEQNI